MTTFTNAVYFHDFVDEKTLKNDLKNQVVGPCEENEIFFEKEIDCCDTPQCLNSEFEVLFFDWGGMSFGNSLLDDFCRQIHNIAADQPDRFYVMVSLFTREAMNEAIKEFGNNKPYNLFLSINDFGSWLKKYEMEADE
jgi:hypothetical protein